LEGSLAVYDITTSYFFFYNIKFSVKTSVGYRLKNQAGGGDRQCVLIPRLSYNLQELVIL
jgi:hypothetical protein